jgi:hypothetical protein
MSTERPPWSKDIIHRLYKWQTCGHYHPYTCCTDNCREELTPTTDGWICTCGYTQGWAHIPPSHEHFADIEKQHIGFGYVKDVYYQYAIFTLDIIKNNIKPDEKDTDKIEEAKIQIYAIIGDLLVNNVGSIKKILETYNIRNMHKELLLTIMMVTLVVRHRFNKEREEFMRRVSVELNRRTELTSGCFTGLI